MALPTKQEREEALVALAKEKEREEAARELKRIEAEKLAAVKREGEFRRHCEYMENRIRGAIGRGEKDTRYPIGNYKLTTEETVLRDRLISAFSTNREYKFTRYSWHESRSRYDWEGRYEGESTVSFSGILVEWD